ncbi:hypothetical protein JKP88DRAFT_306172 [Tribonema minus]|uniref:Uncharacterized protein n=1 Tax=Tribonema minus TaxID=303371 RepID=A0A835ZFI4_9STRA|nr:hypothetical protein JKP88DRAFT_306172 [Tribonema minus]
MAGRDDAYSYVCSRVAATLGQLAQRAELYGLQAIAAQLETAGDQYRGLPQLLSQLKTVLQFEGGGRWLYIAGVSRHWRAVLMATCARSLGLQHLAKTRYTEAVGSVEAFAVAADAGVLNDESSARHIKRALGKRGSRVILSCATGIAFKLELDMHVLLCAAESGDFEWLKLVGKLMQETQALSRFELINAAVSAARSGDDGDMLGWILEQDWGEGGMPQWIGAGLATVAARHGHEFTMGWCLEDGVDRFDFPSYAEHYDDIDLDDDWAFAMQNCFEIDQRSAEAHVYGLLDTAVKADSAVVASLTVRSASVALFKWARENHKGQWFPETISEMLTAAERVKNKPLKAWLKSLQAEN